MDSQAVKALCLDVGNVLVEINIARGINYLGLSVDDPLSHKIHALGQWETYDAFERGSILEEQFLHALRSHLGVELPDIDLINFWNSSIERLVTGIEHVLSDVLGRIPVYALTNTSPIHFDHCMRNMTIFHRFERVIASFHLGHRKPEAQIFTAAANLIGQPPERILFIDDSIMNIHVAKQVGYQAEVCDRSSEKLREILVQYGVL